MEYAQYIRIRVEGDTITISDKDGVIVEKEYMEFKARVKDWIMQVEDIDRYCSSDVDSLSILNHKIKIFV